MRIAYIAAGAAGMYCGSCFRDNAVARELMHQGDEVLLLPLYTPLRLERDDVQNAQVFYGGISIYLQQKFVWFRKPRLIDRWLDSRGVLKIANYLSGSTDASDLGDLTISTLRGDEGFQRKELERLAIWLAGDYRPDLINLPNSMFVGAARMLKQYTGAPVVCSLTGEDLFIEGLKEPFRTLAIETLRERAPEVDHFIATSRYYADHMSELLAVDRSRIDVVPLGLDVDGFPTLETRETMRDSRPFTVGFLARLAPEKGLHVMAEAFVKLKALPGMEEARLKVAGFLSAKDRRYLRETLNRLRKAGVGDHLDFLGEISFEEKIRFLQSIDVLSVPTTYREPKGLFVLEAMASGVPVVQPTHGAFPELIETAGGGLLVPPGDTDALAGALHRIASDPGLGRTLGEAGWHGVRRHFTAERMAGETKKIYDSVVERMGGPVSVRA